MDQSLIEKLMALTNRDNEEIEEALSNLSLDQIYTLIDSARKGNDDILVQTIEPFLPEKLELSEPQKSSEVKENNMTNKNKNTIKVDVPKPRDPIARELEKKIYQPKTAPSRREILDRTSKKHKGSMDESLIEEGLMGFNSIPSIKKMLSLAGRPHEEADIESAMEDYMGKMGNYGGFSANNDEVEIGNTIKPGLVNDFQEPDDFDKAIDALSDQVTIVDDEPDQVELVEPLEDSIELSAFDAIQNAIDLIKINIPNIKVCEYVEVKKLISSLTSEFDILGNVVKGN